MTYVKIDFDAGQPVTVANINHLETQYDEFKAEFDVHDHDDEYYTKALADAKYFTAANDGAGSGLDADTVDGYSAGAIIAGGIPTKAVAIWSGSAASIPAGWGLCDGTSGTPDLRDRFIVGAGGAYNLGAVGGHSSRTPAGAVSVGGHAVTIAEMPPHAHDYTDTYNATQASQYMVKLHQLLAEPAENTADEGQGQDHTHGAPFAGNAYENRPPYYALCLIMKL